jgi:hypothetical protein
VRRGEIGQIAPHDLGPEPAQALGASVLPPDQGAHLVPLVEQHRGEVAAHRADVAGRSGHEDQAAMYGFHHRIIRLAVAFR